MNPTENSTVNKSAGTETEQIPNAQERFLFNCDYLLMFCANFENVEIGDQTDSMLEIKLEDLDSRWVKVKDSFEKLMLSPLSHTSRDFKENAKINFNASSEAYYTARSQILDILRVNTTPNTSARLSLPHMTSVYHNNTASPPMDNAVCIKVPPCDTEVFMGSYEEWPAFRDMFTAVYVNHPKLTRAQKLYHLRNKTRGSAGAIVKRYSLCDENFDLAWNALKTRYENKRVLVDSQLKILFNIPPASEENSDSIQKIQCTVNDCLATLKTLDVKVDGWDPILIYLISTKLPDDTLSLWEQSLKSHRDLPKWVQMDEFLINRYEIVERISSIQSTKQRYSLPASTKNVQAYASQENLNSPNIICKLCNTDHNLRVCPKFKQFTVQERIDFVFQNRYCNNCLSFGHIRQNCKSTNTCVHCKKPHHSLLHLKQQNSAVNVSNINKGKTGKAENNVSVDTLNKKSSDDEPSSSHLMSQVEANFASNNEIILLRTALVQIECRGELFTVRALIDPGSQRTFISERIRSRLQIPTRKSYFEIVGIGGQTQVSNKECELVLVSTRYNTSFKINAIILQKLTKQLPAVSFPMPKGTNLKNLDLADPYFYKSSQIDLILGNDSERFINLDGMMKNVCGETSAYNTVFGWVLSGPMRAQVQCFNNSVVSCDHSSLCELLRKFWEQEEIPQSPPLSEDNQFCEEHYKETTERLKNGRYMVRLPFKKNFPESVFLGPSRYIALAQYFRMEKSLIKNNELNHEYKRVLNEYLSLDHMEESSSSKNTVNGKSNAFYLPHHAVMRPEHKTTKVRVVFNASQKTKTGFSLNDVLYTGPTLQNDLTSIILNWRKYKFVFSGDIQKMYRQIVVHPADRCFQKLVFQSDPNMPVKDFELKTVTFGLNCAPFLAIRTLIQLASDCEVQHPKVSSILRHETYVDDILSGGFSIKETRKARTELIEVLKSAGYPFKKITANDPELLDDLSPEDLYDRNFLRLPETSLTKTLGMNWNAISDTFCYSVSGIEQITKITKRKILSIVAQLFDPPGWIVPIIITAKMLIQQLWLEGLQWDEKVGPESSRKWTEFISDLPHITKISIPRWLQYAPTDMVQIHGFSDASKAAYCACVYIRCQTNNFVTFSNLFIAKSKVAPIQTISLPRLELNGALLLAKLVKYVVSTFNFNVQDIFMWTDSSIVLGWLSKAPWSWETYVANRTSQILELVPNGKWRHVPTYDNPADLGTRGCRPLELVNNKLWWQGPSWLTNPSTSWPKRNPLYSTEVGKTVQSFNITTDKPDILSRFSSYSRALRVISYMFRFIHKGLLKYRSQFTYFSTDLTQKEMLFTKTRLLTLAQQQYYEEEYKLLSNSQQIPDKSSLKVLNPFIDENQVLRVNGRLASSSLPYNERHPQILPGNSRLCYLYLRFLHTYLVHGECSLMCRMVQTEFYVSRLKPRVKGIIHNCKVCTVFKHKACSQIMAPLPPDRCTFTPPFHVTGVDFAGPFELKSSPMKRAPVLKGYVSVFVCFSTKAIHLEVCSDLSSAAFEAAFARFVGRRGLPQRVVSDNGRNFVGASRSLLKDYRIFLKQVSIDVAQKYSSHGFEWSFIPPHAPHMGGLWEAAVKSFKYHFKRIAGAQRFTYEQMSTLLARIEGVLNSRPISAISEDPEDLTALTPGHFIKGSPIMAIPESNRQNLSLLNRWEKLKALHHQFSIRWKEDYLKALHKRYKWRNSRPNLKPGDLVVIIDDLLPPSDWRLGRIEKTYTGSDGKVRISDIRTATGVINRPVVKLCLLPLETDTQDRSQENFD